MIDRTKLLTDLQTVLRNLEADLLERTESDEVPEVGEWLRAEYQQAKDAERTAHPYKQWLDDFITQVAAAWVLSCVFARFLEDNGLVDPPRIAGPGKRLERARDEHTLFFQDAERAKLTDREYLLDIFDGVAKLPAGKDVFGPHNSMNALPNWLGPDAAGELLRFFQKIDSDSGELVHDFTDPDWDTRFLGDLYQDLSEAARKKYALLQTPEFVEEFILDRTLDPALGEFGLDAPAITDRDGKAVSEPGFRMIDPACGSGHFLLGAFPRILDRWQKQEPGTNIRELVQRTLNSIHGVDVNPYALAIARFRLWLASLKASDITKLKDAPAFELNLVCGDSLWHAPLRGSSRAAKGQREFVEFSPEADSNVLRHSYFAEDASKLTTILRESYYQCVVANPPYIVSEDKSLNKDYRLRYDSCHMQYSLAVPFMERIFRLAIRSYATGITAGYTGQITANSFMKREFGTKLVEKFLPRVCLTHVVDLAGGGGAHIPGHTTPTVILFGRNTMLEQTPIRTVMGISGEPDTPLDPAKGKYWKAILNQIDRPGSESEFISVSDIPKVAFQTHPWSIGGGGASELKDLIDQQSNKSLADIGDVGVSLITGEDNCLVIPNNEMGLRQNLDTKELVTGDVVRDWSSVIAELVLWPNTVDCRQKPISELARHITYLWPYRTTLRNRKLFSVPVEEKGVPWWALKEVYLDKLATPLSIVYAEVSTHNHFILDRGGRIFKQTAPVIKLAGESTEEDYLFCLGVLNSSTACFWLKQICFPKGTSTGDISKEKGKAEANRYAFNSTSMKTFPLPKCEDEVRSQIVQLTEKLVGRASRLGYLKSSVRLTELLSENGDARSLSAALNSDRELIEQLQRQMCFLQEELDWVVYRAYGLIDAGPADSLRGKTESQIAKDCRPFSFDGQELPIHLRDLWEARRGLIRDIRHLRLIETRVYKRPWTGRQGVYGSASRTTTESQQDVQSQFLLSRLERVFDIDGRMNKERNLTAKVDISLTSVAKLSDIARQDEQFMAVAEVYRDDPAFDVQHLVEELVSGEHVPLLPVLRYTEHGLRKRLEWEKTWLLQRLEDKLRANATVDLDDYELNDDQRAAIANWQKNTPTDQRAEDRILTEILSIQVPPRYSNGKKPDFQSSGGARYWSLRGKLDVPKERWVSFPHCEGPDGTLMIAWAGYNHLQLVQAISAYYVAVQERLGGTDDPRLVPLLAGVIELLPWLKQWHNEIDPEYNQRMDEVYEGFVAEEAKGLGMTEDEVKAWEPPKKVGRKKKKS